uniref:NADH-ubiquinone oxidoreductase chain 3 n=1 Tax=Romanomermis nielseni TaxID=416167 RepID=A1Z3A5_9BILA|nr:NADH dehydrogenase subunit 3 [Romanomermis nielseni]ABL73788.1 NADH dehydrogenase subunit 3 [Romanomermis nielseni]
MILLILLLISTMIIIMNFVLKELYTLNKNQFSAFECGFDSIKWYLNSTSNHFFKIGLIFITFDLELMYLMFFIFNTISMKMIWLILNFIFFTLFFEYYMGTLSWNY